MNKLTLLLLATGSTAACLHAQDPAAGGGAQSSGIQWKDLTKSGLPIRFYGFLRLDTYYNTARMDSVVIPSRVLAETGKRNDDQFHMDPRLTRFGVDVMPVEAGGSKVSGKLEIDFANFPTGVAESRPTPRIRLAYIDIQKDEYGLRFGQDWDVVSPLFPAINHELLMWNAGNTGDRRAQIQGRYASGTTFELKAALGLTGAITNEDLDTGAAAGERDGFDSGMPQGQLRAGFKPFEMVEKKPAEFGLWGLYGQTQTDTFFNGENRFDTWLVGLDWQVPLCSTVTLRGEAWSGENLADVRGGMGQTINTDPASAGFGEGIASTGGWAELVYQYTAKTKFHLGATIDDPDNEDLSTTLASANRRLNQSGYIGTVIDWDNGVRTGFDTIYWQSEYMGPNGTNGSSGNAVRFDLYFQYNF
ncbi:MAG TPA: hypothetical protein VFD82_05115 [Planctomycetota bacterium]|nr:hypothetical protein [Planctomycetota bacterium]